MSVGGRSRRHLLVLAPQCASQERLLRLKDAATELHDVLIDGELGGCDPGLPDGRSLITGEGLTSTWLRTLAGDAIRHAAERSAALVLVLLGHGFVPGSTTTLYLMGADSTEETTDRAVNVGELLSAAANHLRIPSVLGIIDTCHATGALPAPQDLTAGTRNGRSRLALLMGSSVHQTAEGLSFSRALTEFIRDGAPGAGPLLGVDEALKALRRTVVGQDVTGTVHDGDPFAQEPMWITRNSSHHDALPGSLYGPLAREALAAALGALDPGRSDPDWSGPELPRDASSAQKLRDEVTGCAPSPARERALHAIDSLLIAIRTVEFIRSWLGSGLTTARMRQALYTLLASEQRTPGRTPDFTDVGIVDQLVFDYPSVDGNCRRSVARFVALLARGAGKRLKGREVKRWARSVNAQVAVNDAAELIASRQDERRLRLVLSLHASLTGDWPEMLQAWLLHDGELLHPGEFACPTPGKKGVEDALEAAVAWAEEHAEALDLPLRRLDIAAPSALLLSWRPEEAGIGLRLGVQYDVVLHWSRRLTPDWVLRRIERAVTDRWEAIAACGGASAPVDWLTEEDTAERQVLRSHLRNGRYPRGIGLTQVVGTDDQLLEILLSYTPVLLWPHAADGFPQERHGCLDQHWVTMPEGLTHAYRRRWRGEEAGDVADLRAVWDDREWLRFCTLVRSSIPLAQTSSEDSKNPEDPT
ncbi:hypothetical protein ABT010_39005 [Streptomyces sp. NPDC002668]|uniref:vWA-MoxR associated conflict system protein n=1 Tax=Streptomyces sp. NPDC002668 TaxID=3154422 RepID=UPI003322377A